MTAICQNIASLVGITCYPLSEDGSIAMLDTSFKFADGDDAPVFVEKAGGMIRFFDDGGVLLHFAARGLKLDSQRNAKFIKNAGEPYGVKLNSDGELEIWDHERNAPDAFAKYVSTLNALTHWEREQKGTSSDLSILIEEVEMCLRAIRPDTPPTPRPEYVGISGQTYHLDFDFEGKAVIAISPHKATVSSAIRKILDIRSSPNNIGFQVLIVLDDRVDKESAKNEGKVLNAVGNVWPMTRLEQKSHLMLV